ncbi:hypothetical protein [Streptomyces aculeolatus]|uniref:hypothetical protein n=1 Tax=Streptomyces aculeolatus TaxID=270689 RepID=UPI001CECED9D|nr:hypothetical protein [Streptomyces aculeolatus]
MSDNLSLRPVPDEMWELTAPGELAWNTAIADAAPARAKRAGRRSDRTWSIAASIDKAFLPPPRLTA